MLQPPIERFFISTTRVNVPMYFFLDWTNKQSEYYKKAVLFDVLPKHLKSQINFQCVVKLNKFSEVCVCGIIKQENNPNLLDFYKKSGTDLSIPLLKSNLQKSVRRNAVLPALKSALYLILKCPTLFLRRWPIIVLEDSFLHSSMTTIVWLMMACSHGFQLSPRHINWLLGAVYLATTQTVRDPYGFLHDFDLLHELKSTSQRLTTGPIWGLYFRSLYGGMKHDIHMVNYFIKVWMERFAVKTESDWWKTHFYRELCPIHACSLQPIIPTDILLCSIDFHCFPWIIRKLEELFPSYSTLQLRKAIWHYSSGINCKNPIKLPDSKFESIYNNVVNELLLLQKYIFRLQFFPVYSQTKNLFQDNK